MKTDSKSLLLTAAGMGLLAMSAGAQQTPQNLQAQRITGPLKHAGVYHVTTGTWTRTAGATANAGPDIIYNNTADGIYWTGEIHENGAEWVDEGQLPGASGPFGANKECYRVNGFDIAYGTSSLPGTLTMDMNLYDAYAACTNPNEPGSCINWAGAATADLPENGGSGTGFWTVSIDLAGGAEIDMNADGAPCAPLYDADVALDRFGWGAIANGGSMGWILAGDPNWTPTATGGVNGEIGGTGTYYSATASCNLDPTLGHTGLNTNDAWRVVEPSTGAQIIGSGCYWYGGYNNVLGCGLGPNNSFASQYVRLYAEDAAGAACDTAPDLVFSNPGNAHCGTNTGANPSGPATMSYQRDPSGATVGTIQVVDGPDGEFNMMVCSAGNLTAGTAISNGILYLAPPLGRYDQVSGGVNAAMNGIGRFGADGVSTSLFGNGDAAGNGFVVPLAKPFILGGGTWAPGDTIAFSMWYRCGSASNFSNALQIQFR